MAAYAAVVSLHRTINFLLNSSFSSRREILQSAYEEASSLLQALEGLNGSSRSRSRNSMERVDALEAQIRDSAHKLEDVLEFYELKQLEEEEDGDEEGVMRQEISSFGEAAKKLVKEYLAELSRDDDYDIDDDEDSTTHPDFGVEMIGRSSLFNTILTEHVLKRMRPDDRCLCVFLGEQGSGTRVVMKTLFENAREAGEFERQGWAKVGRGYELKHVLTSLIAQVEPGVDDESLVDATEGRLSEYLHKALENRRYMIVLDGVDDAELLAYLLTTSFPDESNGSVVLVATTSQEVVQSGDVMYNYVAADTFEKDIWLSIRHGLLGFESIPAELEAAGKEILHNTRRLPFLLAKTLVFLAKSYKKVKKVEQWKKMAADKENPIFIIADEIAEVVFSPHLHK